MEINIQLQWGETFWSPRVLYVVVRGVSGLIILAMQCWTAPTQELMVNMTLTQPTSF